MSDLRKVFFLFRCEYGWVVYLCSRGVSVFLIMVKCIIYMIILNYGGLFR